MNHPCAEPTFAVESTTPVARGAGEVITFIRLLRWLGLENEARDLQDILSRLASPRCGAVCAGPRDTD